MLYGLHGYGSNPDGIGAFGKCAPGKGCCPRCGGQPALGGIADRADTILEGGAGAAIGYVFAPRGSEVKWAVAGGALGGLLGVLGIIAITGFGVYEKYGR